MSVFGTRSAAAELARLLDAASTGLTAGIATGPAPAAGSPARLADLALRLQASAPALAAAAAPRADFRATLRTRLVAVASVQSYAPTAVEGAGAVRAAAREAALSWSQGARARRAAGVAVGAMAGVVVVAGIGAAGAQSLPGDPFYGVKKAGESAELRAADGPAERGTTHLRQATRRLDEVTRLTRGRDAVSVAALGGSGPVAGGATTELVVDTLTAMDDATREGSRLLLQVADAENRPALLERVTTFSARQDRALQALVPGLPLAAAYRVQQSRVLVGEIGTTALTQLLEDLPVPSTVTAPPTAPGADVPAPPSAAVDGSTPAEVTPRPAAATTPTAQAEPTPAPAASGPGSTSTAPAPTPTRMPSPRPTSGLPVPGPVVSFPVTLPVPVPTALPSVPLPSLPLPSVPLPSVPALPVPLPSVPALPTATPSLPALPPLPGLPVVPTLPGLPGLPALQVVPAVPSPSAGPAAS